MDWSLVGAHKKRFGPTLFLCTMTVDAAIKINIITDAKRIKALYEHEFNDMYVWSIILQLSKINTQNKVKMF